MHLSIRLTIAALIVFSAPLSTKAQSARDILGGLINRSQDRTGTGTGTSLNNLGNGEIVAALREALQVGAKNASGKLSVQNGYFGNALVKVLMPPEAKKVEATLRQFGMSKLVDNTILSMNRAAEDAATKAAPIFINAITTMSIQDGVNIVKGGNGAATAYLKSRTTAQLTAAFRPVIESSLNKMNVSTYWNQMFTVYNKLPLSGNKVNTDLTAYVTERALQGLFLTIAEEENKIRTNPAARVSDLLRKVFGAK
ncbi:MAG: DUF4197 domain-containing protein [Sphingobacteriales bacterium]|nr:MAG: DUF4197 domain-containing protein [Sphingobacteriales bacterium]